jgi:iron complex outermembrane receptor protein
MTKLNRMLPLMFWLTTGLWGQELGPDDLADLKAALDRPIAAASKRLQHVKEAPADATVLTSLELQEMGYRTLADALEGVLGFRSNHDRAYAGLGVRGLYVLGDQNTRVLVLLDGHALNSPAEVGSSKVGEDFGIPLDFVERIEVIRGPASSLYGNNAFLGMVNVVTRSRRDRTQTEVAFQAADDHSGSLDAKAGGAWGSGGWNLMLSGFKRSGTETHFPELQTAPFLADLDEESRQSAYLQLKGSGWSFLGYAMKRDQNLPSAPFSSQLGYPGFFYRNQLAFGDLRLDPTFGPVQSLIRVFGDWNQFSTEYNYDGIRLPAVEGLVREKDPDHGLGLELQARTPLGERLFLTLGSEHQWHRYQGITGIDPNPVRTEVEYEIGNTYLQAEWQLLDDLDAVAGVQQATWKLRSGFSDTGLHMDIPTGTQTGATPRFSLIWRPTGVDILKLLYGGGYRNPTIFERYYNDGSSFQDNPSLRPERIETLQAIWASLWSDGIRSQLSWSSSQWERLIQPTMLGNGFQQFQNQSAPIHGQALEGELQGNWPGWSAYLQAGAYDWSQQGVEVPNTARFQAACRVTRRWSGWSASLEVRHVGARSNAPAGVEVPSSTLWRASLRREWAKTWLRLSLEDVGSSRRQDLVATDYAPILKMPWDGPVLHLTLNIRL